MPRSWPNGFWDVCAPSVLLPACPCRRFVLQNSPGLSGVLRAVWDSIFCDWCQFLTDKASKILSYWMAYCVIENVWKLWNKGCHNLGPEARVGPGLSTPPSRTGSSSPVLAPCWPLVPREYLPKKTPIKKKPQKHQIKKPPSDILNS